MQIREVCVRYRKSDIALERGESFQSSRQVFKAFRSQALEPVETFRVLFLDGKHRMLFFEDVARGILTSCLVHPREVFRAAIAEAAAGIIVVHNHPSGNPLPSAEDRAVTSQLVEAGKLLDMPVYDHVIVGGDRFFSFAEAGLL